MPCGDRRNHSLVTGPCRLLAVVVVTASVLLAIATTRASAAWWDSPISVDGNNYTYTLFTSTDSFSIEKMEDGANGTGFMGFPSYVGAVLGRNRIAVCDMFGRGSAVRVVDTTGIHTLAGSLTQRGYRDGAGNVALFQGINSGADQLNGLSFIGDSIFLADRDNNAVRVIRADGVTSTLIANTSTVGDRVLNAPVFVASFLQGGVTLFVSDSGNQRILTATQQPPQQPLLSVLLTGRSTGPLAYSTRRSALYYTYGANPIALGAIDTSSVQTTWDVGNRNTLGYSNSLMLSEDQTELLYYGNGNSNVVGVYAIRVDVDRSVAASQLPVLKFPWPPTGANLPGNPAIRTLLPHSPTSYYVVTSSNVYVVSVGGPLPNQGGGSSSSSSDSSSNSNSSGSSGGGSSSSSGSSSGGGGGSSSSDSPFPGRHHGIAAFPKEAFPVNDSCLMSQLYYHIRQDAQTAYETPDYYTQFAPVNDPSKAVLGSVNVSTWCGNVTSRFSRDETISILDFWGPRDMALWLTQSRLAESNWSNTRAFLDNLKANGWDHLWDFCFYNCTDTCEDKTAREDLCVDYRREPDCDDVCKGAIASSVVMASAGIVLIVLMIVSPANIFSALIMVPLI